MGGQLGSAPDPTILADAAIYGAAKLTKGAVKFTKWSAEMAAEIGDWIKPHAIELWKQAKAQVDNLASEAPRDFAAERAATIEGAKKVATKIENRADLPKKLQGYARALAKQFIDEGMTEMKDIDAAVHAALQEVIPDITPRESGRAWTRYGDWKPASTEPAAVTLSQTSGERTALLKLEGARDLNEAPDRTGVGRIEGSPQQRITEREATRIVKSKGLKPVDPAKQLKTALDAVKSRLRNKKEELDLAMATRKRLVRDKSGIEYDAEAKQLKAEVDQAQADHDTMFPKEPITETEQLRRLTVIAERQNADWQQRLTDARANRFPPGEKPQGPLNQHLQYLRDQAKAAAAEVTRLRDLDSAFTEQKTQAALDATADRLSNILTNGARPKPGAKEGPVSATVEAKQRRNTALQKLVADAREASGENAAKIGRALDAEIARVDKELTKGTRRSNPNDRIDTPENEQKRAELEAMRDLRKEIDAKPKLSPAMRSLRAERARLTRSIADKTIRRYTGDFGPREVKAKPVSLTPEEKAIDKELDTLRAERKRTEAGFEAARGLAEWKNKPMWEKALIHTAGLARAAAIGGYHTFGKLFSWDAFKLVEAAAREGVGATLEAIRVIPKRAVAERANLEAGSHATALAQFYAKFFTEGMREAWRTLRNKGDSNLRLEFPKGHEKGRPVFWYDYVGISHAASKAPLLTGDFHLRYVKNIANAIANGMDVRDPMVDATLRGEASAYANRAILQNNHGIASWINSGFDALERKNPKTGRVSIERMVTSTVIKTFLTKGVIKTPLNFLTQAMEYNPIYSLPRAYGKLAASKVRGINLTPEEANVVYRLIVSGSIGTAASVYGIIQATKKKDERTLGGYYQPRQKRAKNEVPFNGVRINGKVMPKSLSHNPFLEQAQWSTTMWDVMHSKLHKKDKEDNGALAGLLYAALAQTSNAPIINPMFRIKGDFDYGRTDKIWTDMVVGLIPSLIQNLAEDTDFADRKPTNLKEAVAAKIPGLQRFAPKKP